MKKTIIFILWLSVNSAHLLKGQDVVNYWNLDFNKNLITIKTYNDSTQKTDTDTIIINNNHTFNYKGILVHISFTQPPYYLHGNKALIKLIKENMKVAGDFRVRINATALLIIRSTGKIEDVGILISSDRFDFDLKAVNFLKNIGPWKPASDQGNTIDSIFFIPINFSSL